MSAPLSIAAALGAASFFADRGFRLLPADPMRTGNTYHEVWTLKDGVSSIENHEYKLFRWAEIVVSGPTAGMELDLSAWVVSRAIIAGIWVAFFQECQQ